MGIRNRDWKLLLPVMVSTFLYALSASAVGVVDTTTTDTQDQSQSDGQNNTETEIDDDSQGFIRKHTWSGSFDRAGDATRDAELQLKSGQSITCNQADLGAGTVTQEVLNQRVAECEEIQQKALAYGQDVESIRKMQRNFAHASRVSDIAAVGAIGAVGYAELIKKNPSQASVMEGVANIQETAGYVSYASGAADIGMGTYALMVQEKKLAKIKETLSEVSKSGLSLNEHESNLVTSLKNAAEKTKSAAYSHMAYGAGKVAVGYASMWLAEKNRDAAANLSSLNTTGMYGPSAPAATSKVSNAPSVEGGKPYYQNNDSSIVIPDGSSTTTTTAATDSAGGVIAAGDGASVAPAADRSPSSLGAKNSRLLSAGGSPGGTSPGGAVEKPEDVKKPDTAKEAIGNSFEVSLSGGGGSRYGGGGKSSGGGAEEPEVPGTLESTATAKDGGSKATGVNPNHVYNEALDGADEGAQGSMAGVNGSAKTLFQVIKLKYYKMMEVGRLQGPGTVEVRN